MYNKDGVITICGAIILALKGSWWHH